MNTTDRDKLTVSNGAHPWFRPRGRDARAERDTCNLGMIAAAKGGGAPACTCGTHSRAEQLRASQAANRA